MNNTSLHGVVIFYFRYILFWHKLFDNLEVGLTIDEIVDSYRSLTKQIVLTALEEAARLLESCEDRPAQEK